MIQSRHGRRDIIGIQRVLPLLQEIEALQEELRLVAACFQRGVLGSGPVARAYAAFQAEGGVTADDWLDWLAGRTLVGRRKPVAKKHLRLASTNSGAVVAEGQNVSRRAGQL